MFLASVIDIAKNCLCKFVLLYVILRTLRGLLLLCIFGFVYVTHTGKKILTNFGLERGRCNDHDASRQLITSFPLVAHTLVNMYCQRILDNNCHTSQGCLASSNCICYELKDARLSIYPL